MRFSFIALVIAVLLPGCVPVTEPLGEIDKAEPDKRLVGKWRQMEETGDSVVIDIPAVRGQPKGLMRGVVLSGAIPPEERFTCWFFCTTIGKNKYGTVYVAPEKPGFKFPDFRNEGAFEEYNKGEVRRYFIFNYTLDEDKLLVDGGSERLVSELMKTEKVGQSNDSFKFYETPKEWLANYLAKTGPNKLFDGKEPMKLRRMKQ